MAFEVSEKILSLSLSLSLSLLILLFFSGSFGF